MATSWYFGERGAGRALGQISPDNSAKVKAAKAWGVTDPDKLNKLVNQSK